MRIKAIWRRRFLAAAIAGLVAVAAYSLYARFAPVTLDLTSLSAVSPSQNYSSLIDAVQKTPVPATGFSFVVLGDTRSNITMAQRVLKRALEEKPLFILHTGDIGSQGTPKEYMQYHMKLLEQAQPVPLIPIPGNHEEGPNKDYAVFRTVYGGLRFSFDYGECRFVGIPSDEKHGVTDGDLLYLRNELKSPGVKYKFVLTHVPPDYVTRAAVSEDGRGFTKNQEAFRKLLEEMKASHVFLGHVHGLGAAEIDGIHYTITGGGGATLTRRLRDEARVNNFVVVRITAEGVKEEAFVFNGDKWFQRQM